MTGPQPTDQDQANARLRREVAERQARAYAEVQAWAEQAFGPGWLPSHRHYLVSPEEEDEARRTGQPPQAAATVYTVKNTAGEQRHFMVEDGRVVEQPGHPDAFGPMLMEPHPTRGFERSGRWCPTRRYALCWSPFEQYQPRTAEQLAALRASRERKKAEREQKQWAAQNPLLAWAQAVHADDSPAPEHQH